MPTEQQSDCGRAARFLAGAGDTAALIAKLDWSATPLGPIEGWSTSLFALVGAMVRSSIPMTLLWGESGILIYNDGYAQICAARHPRILGKSVLESWPEVSEFVRGVIQRVRRGETLTYRDEPFTLYRSGVAEKLWLNLDYSPVLDDAGQIAGVLAIVIDTTAKVCAERRRDSLEAQLRQANDTLEQRVAAALAEIAQAEEQLRRSQKMEAIGKLTGGIAHDFNNLLAGIGGSFEMLENRLAQGNFEGVERFIAAGRRLTRRASSLIQRLLVFARQQSLDPRPTNVNTLIAGMEEIIRRSVGPEVQVEVVGSGGLWTTRIDASQLENALLNLCINARDAMAPEGGRLTIETTNKWLDERAARERELVPGQYIAIGVTDTGCGMPPEVIARAFDPFFTTKPIGEGTGLGLSMVYGFARQSGGQVGIYSEVDRGTTMCVYLPRYVGAAEAVEAEFPEPFARGAGETVLIIDDEPTIRMLVMEVLRENGYTALEAEDGTAGLRILDSGARVDLLITDLGLPGAMNGRQVVEAARVNHPDLRVLYITGFAESAAIGDGRIPMGSAVVTKPFAMATLGHKIRAMLEG